MAGIKHLIECHCFLAIYNSDKNNPPLHKFPVYSFLDELDNIIPKMVQCNNCGTIHFVNKIGASEIKFGKDESKMISNIQDLTKEIPINISQVLIENNATLADYEHAKDIIENNLWGNFIVLSREIHDDKEHVKIMEITSKRNFKIRNEIIEDLVIKEG